MLDAEILRILDVSLNRARESLRVLEDFARFGLDDAGLTGSIKAARHALTLAIPKAWAGPLITHRAITEDVGRELTGPMEFQRAGMADVLTAACRRLTESLRSIEEYAKTQDVALADQIQRLRYQAYDWERRLAVHVRAVARFGHVRLYVLLTETLCRGDWRQTAEAVLRGGADCLQLREKRLSDAELLRRARLLSELCREHEALFLVNDRPDVALAAGANGVHLGQDDLPISAARRILPDSAIVGISTHSLEQAIAAADQAPDYIAVGPMFVSGTKPGAHLAGPSTLKAVRMQTSLPLVAIGGINETNAGQVLFSVPCCLCVCEAVIAQPDVEQAAQRLLAVANQALLPAVLPAPN